MTLHVEIINPYPATTVKELLETKLLIPRKIRHFLRTKKHVLINGETINWQSPVKEGDRISLTFDTEDYPNKTIPMGDANLVKPLYEDSHIIVVNKPEGMKTHGNKPTEIALLNHVSAYCGQTCYVVHRLDMETSGAVLFAKNPFILPILNRLLEDKMIQRQYWALTEGKFQTKKTVYKDKIGRDRHDRRKRVVDPRKGQSAYTTVTRLKTFEGASLVNCQLNRPNSPNSCASVPSRSCYSGDPLYSHQPASRLMLHAHSLSFTHPLTLEKVTVKVKSESFEQVLRNHKS